MTWWVKEKCEEIVDDAIRAHACVKLIQDEHKDWVDELNQQIDKAFAKCANDVAQIVFCSPESYKALSESLNKVPKEYGTFGNTRLP